MTGYYVAVGVLALLNLASIALSLFLWVRLSRMEKGGDTELGNPSAPVFSPLGVVQPISEAVPAEQGDKFSAALMGGEMNLRLSQERDSREPPEKYRYITGLADQGMAADEIARVLHLAPGEVQQLLTLARLGKGEG